MKLPGPQPHGRHVLRKWAEPIAVGLLAGLIGLALGWVNAHSGSDAEPELADVPPAVGAAPHRSRTDAVPGARPAERAEKVPAQLAVTIMSAAPQPTRLVILRGTPVGRDVTWEQVRESSQRELELEVSPGRYRMVATQENARAERDVELSFGLRHEVLLVLEPTRTARLKLEDAVTHAPVARATVVRTDGQGAPQTSDAFGRVELTQLPKRDVTITIRSEAHLSRRAELSLDEPEYLFTLEPASFVAGRVRDENGTPVVHARVASDTDAAEALSDEQGNYRLAVAPGSATIVGIDPAGRSARAHAQVAARQTLTGLDLTLGDPHRIHGRVVDADTLEPVEGVSVRAEAPAKVTVASAVSKPDGRFELEGLPSDWVNVFAQKGRGARAEAMGTSVDNEKELELRLANPSALWGLVTDEAGHAIPGVVVQLRVGDRSVPPLETVADADGAYRYGDLAPGFVSVSARAQGDAEAVGPKLMVRSGAAHRQDLVIRQDATIVGTVKGGPGEAFVHAFRTDGISRSTSAHAGQFTLRLPAGHWVLGAGDVGQRMPVMDRPLDVKPAERVTVELTFVANADGQAMSSATPGTIGASFEITNGQVTFSWVTNDGPAALAGIAVGDVLLQVDGRDLTSSLEAFERTRGAPGAPLTVRVRHQTTTRDVKLERQRGPTFESAK